MKTNPKIDRFLARATEWRQEMEHLRRIVLDCGLDEELKWRKPCYSFEGGNVCIIQPFKEQLAVLFFKGSLLKDPGTLLERPGKSSHVGRRMAFDTLQDVVEMERPLRAFIAQAIEIEKDGLRD